jgi:hypothetical protein
MGPGGQDPSGPPESQGGWGLFPDSWDEFLVPSSAETSICKSPWAATRESPARNVAPIGVFG